MKTLIKTLILSIVCLFPENISATDRLEVENRVSTEYIDDVLTLPVIRQINGGTVFVVRYGEDCPIQMRSAFEHACKILEEYLPPCLPINVYVEWGTFRRSSNDAVISKVSTHSMEGFGENGQECFTNPLPKIKAILLNEFIIHNHASYMNIIPNVDFLNNWNEPDIHIIYNKNMKNDFNFSLDDTQTSKYDFVSVVIRDLVRGLGLYNSFEPNPLNPNRLMDPSSLPTDLEVITSEALGNGDTESRFLNATAGELVLSNGLGSNPNLRLYAPTTWEENRSLNFFIPDSDCAISNILSYEFGRGTVRRNINDRYSNYIFENIYGWRKNLIVDIESSSAAHSGSTQNYIPYKGILSIPQNMKSITASNDIKSTVKYTNNDDNGEVQDFLMKFHPGIDSNNIISAYIYTLAILKKDGTWDVVYENIAEDPELIKDIDTSVLNLNFDTNEYARTCEGYLRARLNYTNKPRGNNAYHSNYYVLDYLPQKIELEEIKEFTGATFGTDNQTTRNIKIGFKNIEGLNKVVIEKYIGSNRLPARYTVTDFKKGYCEISVSNSLQTRLIAVGYNDNGSSKSEPIETIPIYTKRNINLNVNDNLINLDNANFELLFDHTFEIYSLSAPLTPVISGKINEPFINIGNLENGLYLFKVIDDDEGINIKFRK